MIWVAKCRRVALRTSLSRPWQNVCCIPQQPTHSHSSNLPTSTHHTPQLNYTSSASLVLAPALPSQANITTPDGRPSHPATRALSPSQARAAGAPGGRTALPQKKRIERAPSGVRAHDEMRSPPGSAGERQTDDAEQHGVLCWLLGRVGRTTGAQHLFLIVEVF